MAQHDMNIANQGFPAFRADLNDALGALVSNSSGSTEPSTMFAHQFWVDTSANPSVLKQRNADNDAWITIGNIDQTGDKFILSNPEYTGTLTGGTGVINIGSGQLYKDASGNVGFGTSSPSARLDVRRGDTDGLIAEFHQSGGFGINISSSQTLAKITAEFNQALAFETGSTANERMRIDNAGNVGIGTSSPLTNLHVRVNALSGYTSVANSGLLIERGNGPAALNIASPNNQSGFIWFADQDGAGPGNIKYDHANNSLSFAANDAERMRIDSSGNLLVGTTSSASGERLSVSSSASAAEAVRFVHSAANPFGLDLRFTGASPNNTGNWFLQCNDSTALRAQIRANGGLANFSGNNVNLSDRREKTNFTPAGEYLSKICAIPVQTFNYIDQNHEEDPGLTLGVVAQDVQAVAPELVMESNWGTKEEPKMRLSVYQTDLQYALMKCIQEQQAIIESLKARLDAANL
jgi:hypothetical protein